MFTIYDTDDYNWDTFVNDFPNKDIYFDRSYYKALADYQKVKIILLAYENDDAKICRVVQVNDIADCKYFQNYLEKNKYYDIETPYGYGGNLTLNATHDDLKVFNAFVEKWAKENNIVSEFVRYNPLEESEQYDENFYKLIQMKSTVYMKLESEEQIFSDLDSKNRNMVRKAIKNGIEIKIMNDSNKKEVISKFIQLYSSTMDRNNASDFYYFTEEYFNKFFDDMQGKYKLFYAEYEGKIIAASIMIYNNLNLHYYLSGADRAFMNLAPNNLLLFEAAKWGQSHGLQKFHLGGGVSDNDHLFSFKKQFNSKGICPFFIGRRIYNQAQFDKLVTMRKEINKDFDMEKKFLIKYRQEMEEKLDEKSIYNS